VAKYIIDQHSVGSVISQAPGSDSDDEDDDDDDDQDVFGVITIIAGLRSGEGSSVQEQLYRYKLLHC